MNALFSVRLPGLMLIAGLLLAAQPVCAADIVPPKGTVALEPIENLRLRFDSLVGQRLQANIDQWLLCAPQANPGILEMFRLRDRKPMPRLEPWSGEFAGKYLISCVQTLRLSDSEELQRHTADFVKELLATQADDGYLGPFPKARRLLGQWDLWGHYHIMQGLLLWYEYAGDSQALASARRAADLICRIYLDGSRRVIDAGSHEMNMAVAHVLARLYRTTGEPRYQRMVMEIAADWQKSGDYLRTGVAGMPFYKTPRPRWESLHDLQALFELWQITGQQQYRTAFESHWRTILEYDRRNTGAFSGGEQATGNPYVPSPIETCCTVAWMALSGDMLRLTGDPRVADELELSTLNAALGAQHPSGRWWTYNTPMDGERKASAHDIVFQARAGTPELNCCSVNGPRSLGMLGDWAIMQSPDGLTINWLGPMHASLKRTDAGKVSVTSETNYPLDSRILWRIKSEKPLRVRFRVPAWAEGGTAQIAGKQHPLTLGSYFEVQRQWNENEPLVVDLPLTLRAVAGQREQKGKVSLYRGPLLLAYDQPDNAFDEKDVPAVDLAQLKDAKVVGPPKKGSLGAPWLIVELPTAQGPLRLRDFASAGASGSRYRSWLPVVAKK